MHLLISDIFSFLHAIIGTFWWQDPVHSWKAGSGEVMTVGNLSIYFPQGDSEHKNAFLDKPSIPEL